MQFDFVPELPPSGGYKNIVTAMNVFSSIYLPTVQLIKKA